MKKLLLVTIVILVAAVATNAATLDRGVSVGPMFIAGGSANGNPLVVQLKYQMAIDSEIGIKNRYRSIYTTNIYHNDSYDSHDTIISIDAEIGEGQIVLNTNPSFFYDSSSQTIISIGADIGEGQIILNTGNNP